MFSKQLLEPTRFSLPILFLMALGAGCDCQPADNKNCAAQTCPCLLAEDCPDGYDCVDDVCVLHVDQPDAGFDAGDQRKGFGELCSDNTECLSGFCLDDVRGAFCTVECQTGCPQGWVCRLVPDPRGHPDAIGLCTLDRQTLCQACSNAYMCNPSGGDYCVSLDELSYCARDCTFEDCPSGYDCAEFMYEAQLVHQCLPSSGTCVCDATSLGQTRGCERSNAVGQCSGQEVCETSGWGDCSAREPEQESCNGQDDDCNGYVDEGLEDRPCVNTVDVWTCSGTEHCGGSRGWICDAEVPQAEICDGHDNNCNNETDEDFVDAAGVYHTIAHCGGCGIDCASLVPHASATECLVVDGVARCSATACEQGYFLYREGLVAAVCLTLPANLCDPCSRDDDCLAPGSRCLDLEDGTFCGRDCSAASPYGTDCPDGYSCVGGQCSPVSNGCLCNAQRNGTIRACLIDTCTGYEYCTQDAGLWSWSACDISSATEICDGLDNDCDSAIDEGYLNPATSRYEADEHCGFCNNDCTVWWSPEIHHATGSCDTSVAMPQCQLSCLEESQGGIDYRWVDVNGDWFDGCECRRVAGNLLNDEPDMGELPQPWAEYVDENCDGIDGVIGDALFVFSGVAASGDGTLANPFATINEALTAFPTSGRRYILVAEGVYPENITLFSGVKLYGGYASDFLGRDILLHDTIIQGVAQGAELATVNASALGNDAERTVVSGFSIYGRDIESDTADDQDGLASYAVYLQDCGSGLVVQNNFIRGGRGARGGRGSTGNGGYGRLDSVALDGAPGIDSIRVGGKCPGGLWRPGGGGGSNSVCAANADSGGGATCPVFDWGVTPYVGGHAEYADPTGNNGSGGYDWSFDVWSAVGCSHVTESGWPSDPRRNVGSDGMDGDDGGAGSGGVGCGANYGTVLNGVWSPLPASTSAGGPGTPGIAGGGGGAGGGTARWYNSPNDCFDHEQGATGGGGGAGGCGGQGGRPGRQGGASIAVFVGFSAPPVAGQLPTLDHNRIRRGPGGDGGIGGFGGPGGQGGRGGFAGNSTTWVGSMGGKGGDGGNGGPGGGGGGGCGGPSYGILGFRLGVDSIGQGNQFDYQDSVDTGGYAGPGGGAAAEGSVGSNGVSGAWGNVLLLTPCGAAGQCPSGFVCDSQNICIPE